MEWSGVSVNLVILAVEVRSVGWLTVAGGGVLSGVGEVIVSWDVRASTC